MSKPMMLAVDALRLGDVIQLFDGPFGTGVVRQVKDGIVTVFRPYATTASFSYTGGVIPFIGIEEVQLMVSNTTSAYQVWVSNTASAYQVWERKDIR